MRGSASRNGEARREAPPRQSEASAAEGGLRVGVGGLDVTKPPDATRAQGAGQTDAAPTLDNPTYGIKRSALSFFATACVTDSYNFV